MIGQFEDCPPFLQPRLRLFISADIVGSTALKQASAKTSEKAQQRISWLSKIQGFYLEAVSAFEEQCSLHCESAENREKFGPQPVLWKTIGDEVLFVKEIKSHQQMVAALQCWMKAVPRIRLFIQKNSARLDVKCTAWLAGFPLQNSEVALSTGIVDVASVDGDWFVEGGRILNKLYENGDSLREAKIDYIGPSIDIGFRLAQFSSSRKFILSVDVAYILSLANAKDSIRDPVFDVFYDGSEVLKGVLDGVKYPIFWIDLSPSDSIARFEDSLTGIRPVMRDRLREFCGKFYEEQSPSIFPPFIHGDEEIELKYIPEWYLQNHRDLVAAFNGNSTEFPEPEEDAAQKAPSKSKKAANNKEIIEFLIQIANAKKKDDPA